MRLLLDTCSLIWFYETSPRMSATALDAILSPANRMTVSAASPWEVAIKLGTGKLVLAESFDAFVQHAIHDNGFELLPVQPRHAADLFNLPRHHKDPFDRMLVAQARVEGLTLVTCDDKIALYPVPQLW